MRVGPIYRTFAFLLAIALLSGNVHSQTTTSGALSGVVIDQTNAVMPDVAVKSNTSLKAQPNQRRPIAKVPISSPSCVPRDTR
jgi:hypothetical protein